MLTHAAWQSHQTLEPSRAKCKVEGYVVNYLVFRSNLFINPYFMAKPSTPQILIFDKPGRAHWSTI